MGLDSKLNINPAEVKTRIIDFIRPTLEKRDIDGLLILYRYCIESITNVHLAKEIVGRKNVKVLVTKGRFMNKQPRENMDLQTINKFLNLPPENIVFVNKEKALKEIRGIFSEDFEHKRIFSFSEGFGALNYNLSYFLLKDMASGEITKETYAPPSKKPSSRREKFFKKTIAHYKSQIRLRVLLAYLLAESENRSFLGSINKTEWSLGLFTKYGTYHAADFLPLACLYRTQVIQLANHLGLQDFISSKISETPTSYKYFFNLKAEDVDRILIRLESDFSVEKVAEDTNISLETIKRVNYYYHASHYARSVPLIPNLIDQKV